MRRIRLDGTTEEHDWMERLKLSIVVDMHLRLRSPWCHESFLAWAMQQRKGLAVVVARLVARRLESFQS